MKESRLRFGIAFSTVGKGMWSFGVALSHSYDETYLYINIFKLSVSVGRFYH